MNVLTVTVTATEIILTEKTCIDMNQLQQRGEGAAGLAMPFSRNSLSRSDEVEVEQRKTGENNFKCECTRPEVV